MLLYGLRYLHHYDQTRFVLLLLSLELSDLIIIILFDDFCLQRLEIYRGKWGKEMDGLMSCLLVDLPYSQMLNRLLVLS